MTTADVALPISELKADLFRALGNPGRIRILEQLVQGERSVGELQPLVGLESSHLSQQLGVLRRANLVVARKEGSQVFYSVRSALIPAVTVPLSLVGALFLMFVLGFVPGP